MTGVVSLKPVVLNERGTFRENVHFVKTFFNLVDLKPQIFDNDLILGLLK